MHNAPSQTLRYDTASSIIEATVSGFWSAGDVEDYVESLASLAAPLIKNGTWYAIVSDGSELMVQSATVSEIWSGRLGAVRASPPPSALIVRGGLLRLQATRVMKSPHFRIVGSRSEALDWIQKHAPAGWARPD